MYEGKCPICQNSKHMKKGNDLYGKRVCKKCYYSLANRRQGAFVIDVVLMRLVAVALGFGLAALILLSNGQQSATAWSWVLTAAVLIVFAMKDGFSGCSPGKAITGVQVVDDTTLKPIGFTRSFKRNLPTLIPVVPLVIAYQLMKGHRWGDKWSNSRVIWRKYKDNSVFTGAELPPAEEEFLPGVPRPDRPQSDNPFIAPIE